MSQSFLLSKNNFFDNKFEEIKFHKNYKIQDKEIYNNFVNHIKYF